MNTTTKLILAVLTAGLIVIAPARANLLVDGGFETGPAGSDSSPGFVTLFNGDNTSLPGWTVIGDSVDYIGSYWVSAEGQHSLDLSGNNAGGVQQTFATTVGQTYKVSFDLAGNPDGGPSTKDLITSTVGGVNSFNFSTTGSSDTNMNWTTESFEFTANSTSTLLSFVSLDNGYFGPALDGVDVEAVPEPTTMALLAGGILGLFYMVRSRNNRMSA